MPHLQNPNPFRPGPGPEQRLRNLQRRFRAVSTRHDRAVELRRVRAATTVVAFAAVAFAVVWGLGSSPWPVAITLRHIASAPNCDFARLVGLAPARRGEPGYWKHLDRDGDGVACEPWPPRRGAASRPFLLTTDAAAKIEDEFALHISIIAAKILEREINVVMVLPRRLVG
jgi:Excalibur calcium-binding domain